MPKVAILVDGAFYRRRAYFFAGEKTAEERAKELETYCFSHAQHKGKKFDIYRIFYYDCPPVDITVFNPLTKANVNLKKTADFKWGQAY